IAGKNLANPSAIILAGVLMLRHLNENAAADRIQEAVASVLREGKCVTGDLNPAAPVGTTEMGAEIVRKLR
ncbi:MAG TPA: isocitrate/isopropylmalate family dehydrogenase, partial [Bacteroidota bacterium]